MSHSTITTPQPLLSSCLAIDLGAKFTGSFLVVRDAFQPASSADCHAMTLVLPDDGDKMTYSSQARRAVRHRLRNKKRYNLARRLALILILQKIKDAGLTLGNEEEKKLIEAICSLLKRRGYSRLESDSATDLTSLENLDPCVFANHPELGQFFCELSDIPSQWENLTQDLQQISAFIEKKPADKAFQAYFSKNFADLKSQKKAYSNALKVLNDDANLLLQQVRFGHRHRKQYLDEIHQDMRNDSRLAKAVEAFGDLDRLWRLIGNLSNLQLRAMRWYFNAPELFEDRFWIPERLQKTLVRAFKYFHCSPGKESQNQQALIKTLESTEDILEVLCNIDPERTIPAYEDQNNRRPPVDATLLLSPHKLTEKFGPIWKSWADSLSKEDPALDENLDLILTHTDRRSRIAISTNTQKYSVLDYRFSYILQRALDRNKKLDQYALRLLAHNSQSQLANKARAELSRVIGSQHVEGFIALAKLYYAEVADARVGLWIESQANLLEKSNIHPPMKKKILDQLVGDVFGLDANFGRTFIENYWNCKLGEKSRSSMRSTCQFIETIRKQYGGEFKLLFNDKNSTSKDFTSIKDRIEDVKSFLADQLHLSEKTIKRVANPFCLAQLYTLIELDRSGFASNTVAVQLENSWRMSSPDGINAQCSRLAADCVRPFDGVLRKLLDRQAYELAKHTFDTWKKNALVDGTTIHHATVVEENKFAFTASLATLKKNTTAKKKATDALQRQEARWLSKDERIKEASKNICAYTGVALDTCTCEYDHIIPRTLTKSILSTAFNSEANLICVSQAGNQQKKDARYRLTNLHSRYLSAVFGTTDCKAIADKIETRIDELKHKRRLSHFELLNSEDQAYVRHALFLDDDSEARKSVLSELAASNRSKVNGTQAWFIRRYLEKLTQMSGAWLTKHHHTLICQATRTSAQAGHDLRQALTKQSSTKSNKESKDSSENSIFYKPEVQPVASHSIDAMCAYAAACVSDQFCEFTHSDPELSNQENTATLAALHPLNCYVNWITAQAQEEKTDHDSRAIFKEGILSENFLHVLTCKQNVFVGFTLGKKDVDTTSQINAITVTGKSPTRLLTILSNYFDKPVDPNQDRLTCYQIHKKKAFELFTKAILQPEELTAEEKEAVVILDKLRYITERVPVRSALVDKANKALVKDALNLDKKAFTINCDISSKAFKVKGALTLPAYAEWLKVWKSPEIQNRLGKDLKDLGAFDLDAWLQSMHRMNSSKCAHTAVKRVASLPIVSKASGGFRIRRKTLDNNDVYQLHNIANAKYSSFACDEKDIVDWKKPVLFKHLATRSVTSLEINDSAKASTSVKMREFRRVSTENDMVIEMAPGTLGRRYIRIEMNFDTFASWLKNAEAEYELTHQLSPRADIKLNKPKAFIPIELSTATLLGTPRSHLFIEHVGKRVKLWYIVESSNANMLKAYNDAAK